MYPANVYVIRQATADDEPALRELAELDSRQPLSGAVLIGEINGTPAGAVSLTDGRVIADPFERTAVLRHVLRMRADSLRAYSRTPSLPERIRAAMTLFRTAYGGRTADLSASAQHRSA